jgi:predicted phosphoadenosine phosphosulfate sulfurtransferase
LSTLPEQIRDNYLTKFKTSITFWAKTGGGFASDVISEIEQLGYDIQKNGISNFSKDQKERIIFKGKIPDNTDNVTSTIDIPSWKRMCCCILKNDHNCRHMGFGATKEQQKKINVIRNKYRNIMFGGKKDD